VEKIADSDSTIFINGESGTGKGLIAKAIHDSSSRRRHPFISVNCSAIPESLMESELFGHVRGAFTGANADRIGRFQQAHKGTLFLDEVGDMSPDLQVKILKALEEREVEPLGGCRKVKVDVRIITATHRDMKSEVEKGNFREDLYYRLYVIPVTMPALRERSDDIPLLVDHFLHHFNTKNNRCVEGIDDEALRILRSYSWPGNIRELKNMMERIFIINNGSRVCVQDLPSDFLWHFEEPAEVMDLAEIRKNAETKAILDVLHRTRGDREKASRLLNISPRTLRYKLQKYDIKIDRSLNGIASDS